jgi:hypothetical protein
VGRFPPAHNAFQVYPHAAVRRRLNASGPLRPPTIEGPTMADKSPRQAMTKKSGKTLKEKRAVKKAKADHRTSSAVDDVMHTKKR